MTRTLTVISLAAAGLTLPLLPVHAVMFIKTLAVVAVGTVLATSAFPKSAREIRGPSPYIAIENEPAPKLIVGSRLHLGEHGYPDRGPFFPTDARARAPEHGP